MRLREMAEHNTMVVENESNLAAIGRPPERGHIETSSILRIMHALVSMDCGGMENVVLELARRGPGLNQRVHVVCLEPWVYSRNLEDIHVRVQSLDKQPGIRLGPFRQFWSLLHEARPDVLHTHTIGALFYAGPAARWLKIPVVHTEHGRHFSEASTRNRWLARFAALHARQVCCVSRDVTEEIRHNRIAHPRKLAVIYNGIDTVRFREDGGGVLVRQRLGISPTSPVIGTVGRLSEIKRAGTLDPIGRSASCGVPPGTSDCRRRRAAHVVSPAAGGSAAGSRVCSFRGPSGSHGAILQRHGCLCPQQPFGGHAPGCFGGFCLGIANCRVRSRRHSGTD